MTSVTRLEPAGFDAWVRAVCLGAFAYATFVTYDPAAPGRAVLIAVFGAVLALWPERVAFAYRQGIGIPRWTRSASVTRPPQAEPDAPSARFSDYRPQIEDFFRGYVSLAGYLLPVIRFQPSLRAAMTALTALALGGAILWFAGRQASRE